MTVGSRSFPCNCACPVHTEAGKDVALIVQGRVGRAGSDGLLQQLKRDPSTADVNDRERALINDAVALTRSPGSITSADLEPLRQAGLSDAAIQAAVIAYFNFINRIALGLGVELQSSVYDSFAPVRTLQTSPDE